MNLSLVFPFGFVLNSMREASSFKIGHLRNNIEELLIFLDLGFQGIPSKAPMVLSINWLALKPG